MYNIKLVYQYDGSKFYGFQRQPKERTVQGEIEKILRNVLNENIDLISSGRTDRGVHAFMQVSNFFTTNRIPLENLKRVLKKKLSNDILIDEITYENEEFHARFSAKKRAYIYIFKEEAKKTPFESNYLMWIKEKLNKEKFLNILNPLIGRHDFEGFRKIGCGANNTFREIYNIDFYEKEGKQYLYIEANAFLKSMVRIIVGSALMIYFGQRDENYIENKIKNPDKNSEKILAEPQALYLYKVEY